MALREHLRAVLLGLESIMLHVGNKILNWSRWRIRIDGICAIVELQILSIDLVTVVDIVAVVIMVLGDVIFFSLCRRACFSASFAL